MTLLLLAPMAGLTDWPLRLLCYQNGADYACSEMVSAMGFMHAKADSETYRSLLGVHPDEPNTACQLFGSDPVVMGEAADKITRLGRFRTIDINMGCPARKVVGGGDGSALLQNPALASRIMQAVKQNTHLPVTLKTRLGFDEGSMNALALCEAAQDLGFRWVTIHGRTRAQQYSGHADWEAIGALKAKLRIPVIANGDVFTPEDAAAITSATGADGIMIGRGAAGNPWLFRTARQKLAGEPIWRETLGERLQTAKQHALWMAQSKGERLGVMEMRKHLGHYISGLRGAAGIRREVNTMSTLNQLCDLLDRLSAAQEDD